MVKIKTLPRLRRLVFFALALGLFMGTQACAPDEKEIPHLIQQLKSPDSSVRSKAAMSLGAYRAKGKPAVSALSRLLYDRNGGVQSAASYALGRIGTPEAMKAISEKQKRDKLRR